MLLSYFKWMEDSGIGHTIRSSNWLFPVIEAFHLMGLAILGGVVLIVDMRLFGIGLREQPVARLARDVQGWMVGSLALMLITGPLLFMSESVKCYYSQAFWLKMAFLIAAIAYTFTWHRKIVASADETATTPISTKVSAIISVLLWAGVGAGGRLIGFGG
jgi:hypothetical protein